MNGPVPPEAATPKRALPEALLDAARQLLSNGNMLQLDDDGGHLELRAGVGQQHAATLPCTVLEHAGGKLLVALEREPAESPLGDAHWNDYSGDARLLAWTLAHEELLDSVSGVFGADISPSAFDTQGGANGAWLWLALSWLDANQQLSEGWLGLDVHGARTLAAHAAWQRNPSLLSLLGDATSVGLNLLFPGRPLESATATGLIVGDVLMLGREPDMEARLQADHETANRVFGLPDGWSVQRQQRRWNVVDRPLLQMQPNRPQFLLTRLNMSPVELESLRPGVTLAGDGLLVGSTVGIMLGGRRLGEGVLIELGELLGVRITNKEGEHGLQ